ncbi:hypothetical protein XELAEV_18025534mg [Xenopus laevis]|uniref:Uncharacterized protein n=1 Tax=Xenopus laevis TaxID=8355 RepID=A0A974HMG3_XENLA|nr:hypothetical protein XELAEV_18025534mg [Xenopus laevis]
MAPPPRKKNLCVSTINGILLTGLPVFWVSLLPEKAPLLLTHLHKHSRQDTFFFFFWRLPGSLEKHVKNVR